MNEDIATLAGVKQKLRYPSMSDFGGIIVVNQVE
jgi:hypothetical protein